MEWLLAAVFTKEGIMWLLIMIFVFWAWKLWQYFLNSMTEQIKFYKEMLEESHKTFKDSLEKLMINFEEERRIRNEETQKIYSKIDELDRKTEDMKNILISKK